MLLSFSKRRKDLWVSDMWKAAGLSALQEYEEDLREFKLKVDDTDRQVGAIFCQAFEETSGLEHAFKVWEMNLSLLFSHTSSFTHLVPLSDVRRFWICLEACWSARWWPQMLWTDSPCWSPCLTKSWTAVHAFTRNTSKLQRSGVRSATMSAFCTIWFRHKSTFI